nr:MAG TPA: hypothetical protein [Caudoviricetes sp.]
MQNSMDMWISWVCFIRCVDTQTYVQSWCVNPSTHKFVNKYTQNYQIVCRCM